MIRSRSRRHRRCAACGRADRTGGGRRPSSRSARQRRGGRTVPRRGRSRDRRAPQPVAGPSRVGAGPSRWSDATAQNMRSRSSAIGARGDGVARLERREDLRAAYVAGRPPARAHRRTTRRRSGRRADRLARAGAARRAAVPPFRRLRRLPAAAPAACAVSRMETPAGRRGARATGAGGHPRRAAGANGIRAAAGAPVSRSTAEAPRRFASASGSEPDIG